MLRSTFLGYKTATSALKVNQNMMDVVGQNMSNINTKGYTRQRLDINSVSFNTSNLKFGTSGVVIGQGVEASGVSQFRDSFLDLRYRIESAKVGSEQVQLDALGDLESVFDEISMDALDAQFSDLLTQLHSLTSSPSDPVLEGVVRTSAQMLTQMFNNYSKDIETIRNQQLNYLENGAIVKVNQLTDNIAKLNQQIKESNISGNPALELNDERNMLIDELSSYLDIKVDIVSLDIGGGKKVDELVIKLGDTAFELVNRKDNNKIAVTEDAGITQINLTDKDDLVIDDITNSIKGGQIDGYLKFLNGKGEFATASDISSYDKAADVKGVQYYHNMLDTLAFQFATEMNLLNTTAGGVNKPLFDNRDGSVINATNIKIDDDWAKATDSYIVNTTSTLSGDKTGATDNILRMIDAFKTDETFSAGAKQLFKGTFQEFLSYTTTKLNLQVDDVQTSYDTYSETQFQIDYARSSMSSVDLNEEGVNLLQYSKSYNAAARLMTTLDEMLDTLINRMGV